MGIRRTKAVIEAELSVCKRQNNELTQLIKDHHGKTGVELTKDVNRLAGSNRMQAEDLAREKQRGVNLDKQIKVLTEEVAKRGRQLTLLKSIMNYDSLDIERLLDRILENT